MSSGDPEPTSPPPGRRGGRAVAARRLILVLALLSALLGTLLAVREWVLEPFRIASPSMEPTLRGAGEGRAGDTILVDLLAYGSRAPRRWEIVVFRPLEEARSGPPPLHLVKRVVALPGETVEIDEGEIHIDGKPVARPPSLKEVEYVRAGSFGMGPVELGPGEFFVLGDNSYPSVDSRRFGPVPREHIIGRAVWIIWPAGRWGSVD